MGKKLKYSVITINREYSAYGHTIAKKLSERLGLPFYDRDFISATAEQSGYAKEDIEKEGEEMSSSSKFMNSLLNNAAIYTSSYDKIFEAQREVIYNLSKNPCIIVGRCANVILKEAKKDVFSIFLHADVEERIKVAATIEGNKGENLEKLVPKVDAKRRNYYKTYTGKDLEDSRYYNITLDVATIGVDQCVDIICSIVEDNE